ncbi:hypothetical protein [Bacillus thuringiensis]|uniref:hypothetical protein n=1 Tax=Bacillus thuringiensis TaxID=1428 RepID=UPI0026E26EDD|nr:hypothetical protein [Bacillus thuringiensis]MDO6632379.1 hypothetical protein [Bacillus thuringiensis]MDO6662309.1 hypothetical protein [Bacillus thuringiensis]MDO6703115.1 hypothetical protein [Bacillus thuringiensis]
MKIFNKIFKSISKPTFPIVDTKILSNDEIEFLIKEFQNKQENLKWILETTDIQIPYESLEFHELLTAKLTDKLLNKSDLSKMELEILNAMFQKEGVAASEFVLISEITNEENRSEFEYNLIQQGFEFVENVGFIRLKNS